ncbi:hypothetical protein HOC35_05875 [Candidatus Woesearchaeota archaeon]|jgi:hypothetical protein|nr:hypothetical protein [Candidatus Woesearchaeota archaeon]
MRKSKKAFMISKSFDLIWKVIVLLAIASLLAWLIIPKAGDVLNVLMLG